MSEKSKIAILRRALQNVLLQPSSTTALPILPLLQLIAEYAVDPPRVTTWCGRRKGLGHGDALKQAEFQYPNSVTVYTQPAARRTDDDGSGGDDESSGLVLLIADQSNHSIRQFASATNQVRSFIGTPPYATIGMSANPRALYYPSHILLDPTHSDRLYIAELTAVRKYQNGVLSKVFGPSDGSMGYAEGSADDVLSNGLSGMMLSPDGDVLYFSDGGNCRIRRCVNVTGAPAAAKTESFAGNGFAMGADGTGDNASINRPQFMAAARDDSSIVYVTSQAFVRRLNLKTRELTTVLTRGLGCEIDPTGIAMTPSGLLLVACNATNCIYSINPITGDSHLVAGRLTARGTGRGFDADITACEFCDPNGICVVESERCLAVADSASHKIRRVPLCDHFFEPLPTASATSPKAK